MAFAKKLIILSNAQNLKTEEGKGLVSIEKTLSGIKGNVSLYNLENLKEGEYTLFLKSGNDTPQRLRLGKNGKINKTFPINPQFDIDGRICALVSIGANPVLYGANCNLKLWQSGLDGDLALQKDETPEITVKQQKTFPNIEKTIDLGELASLSKHTLKTDYDDTAIATVNYYSLQDAENGLSEALKDMPFFEPNLNVENEDIENSEEKSSLLQKNNTLKDASEVNWDNYNVIRKKSKIQSYAYSAPKFYSEKYVELKRLFDSYPNEPVLSDNLEDTVWVRVDYSETQYYVVGLIGKNPDYIAYGIPGKYSLNPPRELASYCTWLPTKSDDLYGDGYWMMYQDTETGECVKLNLKAKI